MWTCEAGANGAWVIGAESRVSGSWFVFPTRGGGWDVLGLIPYECTRLAAGGTFPTRPWCAGLRAAPQS